MQPVPAAVTAWPGANRFAKPAIVGASNSARTGSSTPRAFLTRLTTREREVGDLIARGFLNKQIAFELGASENTVKVHRARVMHKLRVDSVAALVQLVSGHRPPSSSTPAP